MVDFVFLRHGVSAQGEHHMKTVIDHVNGGGRHLRGGYVQAGFFPGILKSPAQAPREFAARVAYVDPDTAVAGRHRRERSGGVSWYFNQHRNKISFDVARLAVESASGVRLRLQWDLLL